MASMNGTVIDTALDAQLAALVEDLHTVVPSPRRLPFACPRRRSSVSKGANAVSDSAIRPVGVSLCKSVDRATLSPAALLLALLHKFVSFQLLDSLPAVPR
jgi:hypothetical protein